MNCNSISYLPRSKFIGLFSNKLLLRINSLKCFKRYEVKNPLSSYLTTSNYYSAFNRREINSHQYSTRFSIFSKFPSSQYHLQHILCKENVENIEEKSKKEEKPPSKSDLGIDEKLSLLQKFKLMYKQYWYVVIPVHAFTSIFWFGGFFYAAKSGMDIDPFLEKLGVSLPYLRDSDVGYYGIAYAMYKIATPARYTVTLGGTTIAINYLKNKGYIKPVPTKEELKVMYEDKKEELKEKSEEMMGKYQEKKDEMKEIYHEKVDGLLEKYQGKADEMRGRYKERRNRLFGRYGFKRRKYNGRNDRR